MVITGNANDHVLQKSISQFTRFTMKRPFTTTTPATSRRRTCFFLMLFTVPPIVACIQIVSYHVLMGGLSGASITTASNLDLRLTKSSTPQAPQVITPQTIPFTTTTTTKTSSSHRISHDDEVYDNLARPSTTTTTTTTTKKNKKCSNKDGIIAFTYASHRGSDDRFCRSLESAARHGIHLNILGWMVPWKGLSQKITGMARAVESLEEDCLALFNDAYDIIYEAPLDTIRDVYRREFPSAPILFSAECGCWPQIANPGGAETCNVKYPASPTKYRFLNSGQWMSRAADAAHLLNWIVNSTASYNDGLNDQELLSDSFARGIIPNLKLDVRATIFQSMHDNDDAKLPSCTPSQDVELVAAETEADAERNRAPWRRRRWVNRAQGTRPSIFHFNGSGKNRHLSMERPLVEDYEAGARRADLNSFAFELPDSGRQILFGEICPGHIPSSSSSSPPRA